MYKKLRMHQNNIALTTGKIFFSVNKSKRNIDFINEFLSLKNISVREISNDKARF